MGYRENSVYKKSISNFQFLNKPNKLDRLLYEYT